MTGLAIPQSARLRCNTRVTGKNIAGRSGVGWAAGHGQLTNATLVAWFG